jgi:hypothetical protein
MNNCVHKDKVPSQNNVEVSMTKRTFVKLHSAKGPMVQGSWARAFMARESFAKIPNDEGSFAEIPIAQVPIAKESCPEDPMWPVDLSSGSSGQSSSKCERCQKFSQVQFLSSGAIDSSG